MAKRVAKGLAVAQDVLQHLKYLNMRQGAYISGRVSQQVAKAEDLQEVVDVVQKKCNVCLLGACLLSKARLYDQVPLSELFMTIEDSEAGEIEAESDLLRVRLEDCFSHRTMSLMEAAFECTAGLAEGLTDSERDVQLLYGAVSFGLLHTSLSARVEAVMKNVVQNGGLFKPPPKTEDEYVELCRALNVVRTYAYRARV